MTHAATEVSEYSGSPIELFLFQRGLSTFWGYTSTTETKNVAGQVYIAVSMSRSNFEASQDYRRNNLKIKMPLTAEFVQQYISSPPTDKIDITVYQYHEDDPDQEVVIVWTGRVINLKFGEKDVEVLCESIETVFDRNTLRRQYSRGCTFQLYDPDSCKVDPDNFVLETTLSAVDGIILTSSDFGTYDDGYFAGGYLVLQVGSILNKRFILTHVGNDITINLSLPGLAAGVDVSVYPGCAHTTQVCADKFNNILNYGGQPFIPLKNPMNGTPIY